jgi:hypothetical protein
MIFRYNYVFDCVGYGGMGAAEGYLPDSARPSNGLFNSTEYNRSYHNTCYNNLNVLYWNAPIAREDLPSTTETPNFNFQEMWFINNIFASITQAPNPISNFPEYLCFARNFQRLAQQGHSDWWIGAKFDGNMIDADSYTIRLQATGKTGDGTVTTLASAISTWPNTWLSTNNTNAPTFVNAAARTRAGFALDSGSNGEDEAVAMTTTTAGSSGTTLTVDDAYWIYDGFDLSYFGESGDYIAIYDSDGVSNERIRQVSSVDSKTSVTLTASVTVASGDKIFAVLSDGTTVVKNTGAAQ